MAFQNRALGSMVTRTELKTGKRPPPKNVKVYPPGASLFKEGEIGRELFIISEGEITITKGEKGDAIELAKLGAGAIIGEMSLLDNLPRSATATTTMQTKTVIINEVTFNAVSRLLPVWLTSIIRIITSRLRDTNKSIGNSILTSREKGVAHLLYMAACKSSEDSGQGEVELDYYDFIFECQLVTRLKKGDVEQQLSALEKRSLLMIRPGSGTKILDVPEIQALKVFVDYKFMEEQKKSMPLSRIAPFPAW